MQRFRSMELIAHENKFESKHPNLTQTNSSVLCVHITVEVMLLTLSAYQKIYFKHK